MSLTLPADAGEPMCMVLVATPKIARHAFPTSTRQISLRNTGTNTLWISFDRRSWVDIACGTSLDDRVIVEQIWYCTQVGTTRFVVIGLALLSTDPSQAPRDTGKDQAQISAQRPRRQWLPSRQARNRR